MYYSVVPCCEEHNTATEDWSRSGGSASVVLRCSWSLRHALMHDLLSNRRPWPYSPGPEPLRATTASLQTFGEAALTYGQTLIYADALISVGYSSKEEADVVSETLEPAAEFLTEDYRRFRWGAGDGPPLIEAEAPGRLLRSMNLVRTIYEVPSPLPDVLLDGVGGCNHQDYESVLLGLTFPEETLLFSPPSLDRTITTEGIKNWTLQLRFNYKKEGWNKYWRAESQTYEAIFLAGGAEYKSYPPTNYEALLF